MRFICQYCISLYRVVLGFDQPFKVGQFLLSAVKIVTIPVPYYHFLGLFILMIAFQLLQACVIMQ